MARSVLSPLRALPWGEGMARSGNVSLYVLQQKCCDPNKLTPRAIRVVAFYERLRVGSKSVNRSLLFCYSTSAMQTRGRKELGCGAMQRASIKHGRTCKLGH